MKNHSLSDTWRNGMALGRDIKGSNILKGLRGLSGVKGLIGIYRAITCLTGRKSLRGLTQSDDSSSSHT